MDRKNELHSRALVAAKNFKEAERALQEVLREIDRHRVFYDLGYRSLMEYALKGLGLSPDVAYNHCTVARKSHQLPEVKQALSEGRITVSAVRHMAPILTRENQNELISLGSQLTQTELRREVAKRIPEQSEVPEKARYVREDRLALELRVSEELMKKLRRAQDLVSEKGRTLATLEETFEAMVDVFLEKRDPLKKAERAAKRAENAAAELPLLQPSETVAQTRMIRKNEPNSLIQKNSPNRISQKPVTALPAAMKHLALRRANGRCMHRNPDGSRCEQTRWLHFHHIQPLSGAACTIRRISRYFAAATTGWFIDCLEVKKINECSGAEASSEARTRVSVSVRRTLQSSPLGAPKNAEKAKISPHPASRPSLARPRDLHDLVSKRKKTCVGHRTMQSKKKTGSLHE